MTTYEADILANENAKELTHLGLDPARSLDLDLILGLLLDTDGALDLDVDEDVALSVDVAHYRGLKDFHGSQ